MCVKPLKLPQVPFVSVAEARSSRALEASIPDCESLPFESVSGTDSVVYQGPPESATDSPAGAVVSAEIVSESLLLAPAPFAAPTVREPGSAARPDHESRAGEVYGL